MDHNWVIETIDSGYLGVNDFWLCDRCGAGGGPVFFNEKTQEYVKRLFKPFLPGTGIKLTDDCAKAQELMAEYRKAHPLCVHLGCTREARTSGLCSTHFEEELEGYKEEAVDQLDNLTSPPDSKDK